MTYWRIWAAFPGYNPGKMPYSSCHQGDCFSEKERDDAIASLRAKGRVRVYSTEIKI